MRGKLTLCISVAVLSLPIIALAQAPAAPAIGPAKVGWISLEQVIAGCNEGKQLVAQVQKFVEQKNTDIETMKKDLDQMRSQLDIQGSKLTDEARLDLEDRIEAKDTEVQRFQDDTQKEIDSRRTKLTNQVGKKMLPIVDKLAKEKGLTFILYINPQIAAWIDPNVVITDDVIKAYDAAYPVAAAPATPPAKP